ncbi:MAG: hypothetical protein AB1757_10275 [Acidobacteriota bacterium]
MAYTYEELKPKTLAELRDIGKDIVQGYSQMNKEHLLREICKALNIDMHAHHQVVGINKTDIKSHIKELKAKRDEVIAEGNHTELKKVRRAIHRLKRQIHKSTV